MVKRLVGELVSGVKGNGFNLNFALEKAADEPKKAIVEAEPKILIKLLSSRFAGILLTFVLGFGIKGIAGEPLRCWYRKYDLKKPIPVFREIRP